MYNSPIIDIAIGLVFIFLLYSLLATSVQEAIATIFGLRASMLKKCIIDNMLSDAPSGNPGAKFIAAILGFFSSKKNESPKNESPKNESPKNESSKKESSKKESLGQKFYDHPVIKNYGENKLFSSPSYIPKNNFPSVLIDILLEDFTKHITQISDYKIIQGSLETKEQLLANLNELSDVYKIKEILTYHLYKYNDNNLSYKHLIDCDTCKILEMHLRNSNYDLAKFSLRLEGWFDDSMKRVSGWYKRQSQFTLFLIGIVFAILFNVDTLRITDKLSTDKDARDKLVKLATDAAERYKDDPRVQMISKKIADDTATEKDSTTLKQLNETYEKKIKDIKDMLNNDIKESGEVLALGWNQFGRMDKIFIESLKTKYKDKIDYQSIRKKIKTTEPKKIDSLANVEYFIKVKKEHPFCLRTSYMLREIWNNPRSLLGYLILAFGVCLGAPFWFDLLNKLINIRGAGKKENTNSTPVPLPEVALQPISMTVNNQQTGEEAVG